VEHSPDKGLELTTRRGKLRRVSSFQNGPAPPSDAQRQKLFMILGGMDYPPSPYEIEQYVRFANGYTHATLTKAHFIEAITLALEGFNSYGFADELFNLSQEPDAETTPHLGEMKRRLIARQKAAKAAKYSPRPQRSTAVGTRMPSQKSALERSSPSELREAQRKVAMDALAKSRFRKDG